MKKNYRNEMSIKGIIPTADNTLRKAGGWAIDFHVWTFHVTIKNKLYTHEK